jgi:hypothetical protein
MQLKSASKLTQLKQKNIYKRDSLLSPSVKKKKYFPFSVGTHLVLSNPLFFFLQENRNIKRETDVQRESEREESRQFFNLSISLLSLPLHISVSLSFSLLSLSFPLPHPEM